MTEPDLIYIRRLIAQRKIVGPVLELGAGYGGATCRKIISDAGFVYYASDMHSSPGVDFVADFESDSIEGVFPLDIKFKSILVLNVLEHAFNPIRILDNAKKLLDDEGSLVVITPAVWRLHNYPIDCYRILPDWYERYASSRNMLLDRRYFEYLGYGRVDSHLDACGAVKFPPPEEQRMSYWKSRIVHRLLNTFGRRMLFPNHLAVGAVMSLDRPGSAVTL